MATFSIIPTQASLSSTVKTNILEASLGDGYKQRAANGINTMPELWNVRWVNKISVIDTIEAFFVTAGGYISFDWIPPRQLTTKKFICKQWNRNIITPDIDEMTTVFEQVWDY